MAPESSDVKKLIEGLSAVGGQLAKAVVALDKLAVNWELVPGTRGPIGLVDQACTQDNQCEPNPGCQVNSGC